MPSLRCIRLWHGRSVATSNGCPRDTRWTILAAVNLPMALRRVVSHTHRQAHASTSAAKCGSARWWLEPSVVDELPSPFSTSFVPSQVIIWYALVYIIGVPCSATFAPPAQFVKASECGAVPNCPTCIIRMPVQRDHGDTHRSSVQVIPIA